jgi:hypothetical protein
MESHLKELEEVFGQVSSYECRRRINLREYMILLCTSTKWVFTGAEAAQAVSVRAWIEKDTSADAIQEQVSQSVRERFEKLLEASAPEAAADDIGGEDEEDPVGMDGEVGQPPLVAGSDPVSVAMFYANLFPATSPLQSEFLACACVVERVFSKNRGGKIPAYPALAVVTSDLMLHLFDLKEGTGIALDDPPERALDAILKDASAGSGGSSSSSSRDYSLDPSRTVDLSQMRATLGGASDDNVVELTMAPDATQTYPPLSLRTFSAREQTELINAIHGNSIDAMF